jgi:dTDP-4-dehydrorhamnose 3,5-epimerase
VEVRPLAIPDVLLVAPEVHRDPRGFFLETWQAEKYAAAGIDASFVQDNHSRSARGTLRGIHAQLHSPQGKLVRVSRGEVFDVAVDIRPDSPTFGHWVGETLSEENGHQLWIPPGFGHAFCVVSDVADFEYKCSTLYTPDDQVVIRWDDPAIGVEWPIAEPLLSDRDRDAEPLADWKDRLRSASG